MQNPLTINPKLETEKIIKFLKKTFKEQKIDKVILGLSGGIDSTVALYLLRKVLPAENIFAVRMDYKPRKNFSIDLKGINVINFSIKEIVDLFVKESEDIFFEKIARGPHGGVAIEKNDIKLSLSKVKVGNIMARVRMIILFDLAKQLGAMVCGTENKSERLLGYFTRFGDSASDLEPISHLYKTQIYQLAKYLKIPDKIINQSPTAGLWEGQTDESDFGFTYEEVDHVLYQFLDPRWSLPSTPIGGGDDIKHLKILIKKLMKNFPNAEKIIKRFQENKFKHLTPYFLV